MNDPRQKNVQRFSGFAAIYDDARPALPPFVAEQLTAYRGCVPNTVVDLGCGTGLSTRLWEGRCRRVIGIEPNDEMRAMAAQKATANMTVQAGFGNETGLPDGCADVVVCSQSFHWMEPVSTLREAARLLVPNGVFATVDCDWPPVMPWQAEKAYQTLVDKVRRLEEEWPDVNATFIRYPKEGHLAQIAASGRFTYWRELVFHHTETADATRLVRLLLSQGGVQTLLKQHPDAIETDVADFCRAMETWLPQGTFPLTFGYRMRVGVRNER